MVIASVAVAVSETFAGLVESLENTAPESTWAVVVSLTMLMATPAPTPTVPAPSSLAIALAVLATLEVADSVRSPPLSWSPGGPRPAFDMTNALVVMSAIVSASEPAMPTFPPPAPEVASVSRVCVPSLPPELRMAATSDSPFERTSTSVPTIAWFMTVTRLIATAAPMFAVFALVALALAFAFESVSEDEPRLSPPAPPVLTTRRTPAIVASAVVVTIAMATAAATVTFVPPLPPFSPVLASGVFLPVVLPLESLVVATSRFLSAFSLTSLSEVSFEPGFVSFFSSAPAELACASVSFDDEPSARKLTGPFAVRDRPSVDSTSWFAIKSASDMPIPALPPFVSPDAFVVVFAFCVA